MAQKEEKVNATERFLAHYFKPGQKVRPLPSNWADEVRAQVHQQMRDTEKDHSEFLREIAHERFDG